MSQHCSDVFSSLLESLSVIADPRGDRGKRYPLIEVLCIAVLGCVCGCDDAEALEDWAKKESNWLSKFLRLKHGTPGQDVFLRLFAALDPEQFRTAFVSWSSGILRTLGMDSQVAIDGQTHRGSRNRATHSSPIHMVSALGCEFGFVLGQLKTSEKSNEIKAIPELLDLLDIRGGLVSIDAMGCQVAIAKKIINKQGDYLLGLKGNQSSLRDETAALFESADRSSTRNVDEAQPPEMQTATEVDKGHGRLETRTAKTISDFGAWIPAAARWPGLKTLIAIESEREELLSGKKTTETRYYISSRELTPHQAMNHVRNHWRIENQLHWCLDVTFGQDDNATRTKNAAENLGIVRHIAMNLVRNYTGDRYSIPRRRRLCDYKPGYRDELLGLKATK